MAKKIKKFHVYKFINNEDKILYIGRTSNLKLRLETHDHLPKECYSAIDRIEIMELDNEYDMCNAEGYFIDLYKPIYNSKIEPFNNAYPLNLWNDYKMKTRVGSIIGRYSNVKRNNPHIIENILLYNVPIEIRNFLSEYKEDMNIKSLKNIIKKLNSKLNLDKKTLVDISCDTKTQQNSWEFSQDLSFGFINGKLNFTCNRDSYIPEDLGDFYNIDLIDMYNVLVTLMNFYYNKEKFKYMSNKIYNINEDYIPLIRNGVLITSREQFVNMCDEELAYRLAIIEKEKSFIPSYLINQ